MTIKDAVKFIQDLLTVNFIEEPDLEAKLIVCNILKIDTKSYILSKNNEISDISLQNATNLAKSRLTGRSLASILGYKEFYEDCFIVNDDCLIPRPETELLVDKILKDNDNTPLNVLEIGVGSGCISVSLAKKRPTWHITAIDISEKAVQIAKQNAQNILGDNSKLEILNLDFFAFNPDTTFDIIVSNPPYIPTNETTQLLQSKTISDPRISLDGGIDGLDFYKAILNFAHTHLNKNGAIYTEHAYNQKEDLADLAQKSGFSSECFKDWGGLDRITKFVLQGFPITTA